MKKIIEIIFNNKPKQFLKIFSSHFADKFILNLKICQNTEGVMDFRGCQKIKVLHVYLTAINVFLTLLFVYF
jgi:hypothetical protein